ncbi:MAG: BrnT family toxin [Methylomonas sp.]
MRITFDLKKDDSNIAKHGISLALCTELEWESALIWPDTRYDYGEERMTGLALIDSRLYCVVFTDRDDSRRVISLRKANIREVKRYVSEN